MKIGDAVAAFARLTAEEKASFLAALTYELTVVARDTYGVGSDGLTNPGRMRAINEVQHRVAAFLWALLRGDPKRFPDEVLVHIILEQRADAGLHHQVSEAFDRALSRSRAAA